MLAVILVFAAASAVFLFFKVRERERLLAELIADTRVDVETQSTSEIVLALSQAIHARTRRGLDPRELDAYARWESASFFNVSSAVSLKYGGYGVRGHPVYGACGTMSRTLLNALWKLDIPARKLQLRDPNDPDGGHTMVEFHDGKAWRVISPSDSSFVWRKHDGTLATAEEIRNDRALFATIHAQDPGFPYDFEGFSNIRWRKIGPLRRVARAVLGSERYARAQTPRLYDKPRTLLLGLALGVCAASAGALVILYARGRRLARG